MYSESDTKKQQQQQLTFKHDTYKDDVFDGSDCINAVKNTYKHVVYLKQRTLSKTAIFFISAHIMGSTTANQLNLLFVY